MSGNVEYLINATTLGNDVLNAIDIWARKVWSVTTQPLQWLGGSLARRRKNVIRWAQEDLSRRRGNESSNRKGLKRRHCDCEDPVSKAKVGMLGSKFMPEGRHKYLYFLHSV